MKIKPVYLIYVMSTTIFGCHNSGSPTEKNNFSPNNPFAKESSLPFHTADFNNIKDGDFAPAFVEGMKEQLEEITKIAENKDTPTFENTLVAMEKSGQLLGRAQQVFSLLSSANTNETLQKIDEEFSPKFSAHNDAIYLNSKLFQRVEKLYNEREKLNLDKESVHLIEYYYQKFIMDGAKLSDPDKEKLKKLNEEDASLSTQFSNTLLAAAKAGALVVSDVKELDGLTENEVAAAAADAKADKQEGKWKIPLQNTTQQPLLASLKNRTIREKLFDNSWNRAERGDSNDTRKIISKLAELRTKKAALLGFPNYAAWKLQDQMAKNPENVFHFLNQLIPATVAKAHEEAAVIQSLINQQKDTFQLQPYDWEFYADQVRKAKYDLDVNIVKPYFVLDSVLKNGVFYAANQLYGITFKERKDLPVYQKDVRVFEVIDQNGSSMALFYADYFKRDNKNGGAWMDNIVIQSDLLGEKPVVYNVCNFTKPAEGQPALLTFDDVTTMFHEFGHALHGMFASQKYPSLSGTRTPRDFVEFPSQFNEHWALYPQVLKNYARHYQTGNPIPQELIDKIHKASTFNQGYAFTEYLAAAALDMNWHTLKPNSPLQDPDVFEKESLSKINLWITQVPPRYRSSYFLHIWSLGYSAAYYAYSWAEMLDDDAYTWFEENGGMTRANGQRFRDMILSRGNTEDFATLFKAFRGKDPSIAPLLRFRGLK